MNIKEDKEKRCMSIDEAAVILSDTLQEVAQRKTTLRRALVVSRLALALSRVIETTELRAKVEFFEQSLKKRK